MVLTGAGWPARVVVAMAASDAAHVTQVGGTVIVQGSVGMTNTDGLAAVKSNALMTSAKCPMLVF